MHSSFTDMSRERLSEELARLVREYHEALNPSKTEAWNLIADFSIENSDAIVRALQNKGE